MIGGGIGGLATAVALRRADIEVIVHERFPESRGAGAGLQLWTNGIQALDQLGLASAVLEAGATVGRFQWSTWRGRTLVDGPLDEFSRRHGSTVAIVPRAGLVQALAGALPAGTVRYGAHCVGVEQDEREAIARFADGGEERADLLIGADGIRSTVRQRLFGDVPLRYAGYQEARGLADFVSPQLPPNCFQIFWGPGARFGLADAGHGRAWIFAVFNAPEWASGTEAGQKHWLLERYRGWIAPVADAIEAIDEAHLYRSTIYDLTPLPRWSVGRVTLLGDAAHATTPSLGRGAGEALQDAAVLGHCLREAPDVAAGLRAYESRRRETTARVVRGSRRLGTVAQLDHPLLCTVRDLALSTLFKPVLLRQMERDFRSP